MSTQVTPGGSQPNPILNALLQNLGSSPQDRPSQPQLVINGFTFPAIPDGVPTTIIPVAVPISSLSTRPNSNKALEQTEVMAAFLFAALVWMLPWVLINKKLCCRCFQRWLSQRMHWYFCLGLIFNITMISCVIAREPDVSANDIFFLFVSLLEILSDKLMQVLNQVCIIAAVFAAFAFRKKIVALLGFDQQVIRADLRDVLTCFTMSRFRPIEVSLWNIEGLSAGFTSRTLFARVLLGFNEAKHSRPHNGCTTALSLKERMQLNYDPEDDTQQMSIVIKQQEVIGEAISAIAPAAGLLVGAAGGLVTPLGPAAGAGLGMVTGVGAANSLGVEIARVDLSSAMINRLREAAGQAPRNVTSTGPLVPWSEAHFTKVDLVPQGCCWLRIVDSPEP